MEKKEIFGELMKRVEYAKKTIIPRQALYEAHWMIKMARELDAITIDEYMRLNTECVRNGINNPKYF